MRTTFIMLILSWSISLNAITEFKDDFWTGHMLRGNIGFIVDYGTNQWSKNKNVPGIYHSYPNKTKVLLRGNPTFFYGYEYGRQFARNWYWSLGLEWTIAYPRNFRSSPQAIARDSAKGKMIAAWLQPLTQARMGYVFDNQSLLSLGLTYLWGISLNYRIPLSEHLFFETQYVQWLDGFFNVEKHLPTLAAAFDFSNFGIGLGYKF